MKFITEEDLRDLYKKQPFMDYDLKPGERLTPGARQFLLDRGINLYDDDPFINPGFKKAEASKPAKQLQGMKQKKYCSRMKSLQALFLLTADELKTLDVCMAQQLTELYRHFTGFKSASEGTCKIADLPCKACTGIKEDNFSQCIGDCFDITEFHMQLEKGRAVLLLARLKASLEEFDAELPDFLEAKLADQISAKLNQVINTLAQMICSAVGGTECQRN